MKEHGKIDIRNKILLILSNIFSDLDVDAGMLEYVDLLDDIGMDSICFITLIIEIEAEFDIQIPEEWLLMERFRTLKIIIDTIYPIVNRHVE